MRRIGVIIEKDGHISLETQGFQGEACLEEAQALLKELESLGMDTETVKLERSGEYYAEERAKAKIRQD